MRWRLCIVLLFATQFGAADATAQQPVMFTTEHVDVDIRYAGGSWDIGWHDEDNDLEYSSTQALVFVKPQALVSRPAGGQWDFLGTAAGNNLWVLPQSQNANLVYLGVGAEEVDPLAFITYTETDSRLAAGPTAQWVRLNLKGISGPGAFSAYTTDSFGTPIVWMASTDGITASDALYAVAGGHSHVNWAFTQPGSYQIDFEASALLDEAGNPRSFSGDYTLTFAVNAVPEPAALLLVSTVVAGAGVAWWRHRSSLRKLLSE